LHKVFDNGFCMSQTSDDSTDVTILVERFGTTSCEMGNLVTTELVDLLGDVSKHSAVVQLLLLLVVGFALGLLRHTLLVGLSPLVVEL